MNNRRFWKKEWDVRHFDSFSTVTKGSIFELLARDWLIDNKFAGWYLPPRNFLRNYRSPCSEKFDVCPSNRERCWAPFIFRQLLGWGLADKRLCLTDGEIEVFEKFHWMPVDFLLLRREDLEEVSLHFCREDYHFYRHDFSIDEKVVKLLRNDLSKMLGKKRLLIDIKYQNGHPHSKQLYLNRHADFFHALPNFQKGILNIAPVYEGKDILFKFYLDLKL